MKKIKYLIYISLLFANLQFLFAQPYELIFDQPLPEPYEPEYIASDHISLLPGFSATGIASSPVSFYTIPIPDDIAIVSDPISPSERTIDKNLPFGSLAGTGGVNSNGAATYSIPIYTPPGSNSMEPGISVNYNSQSTNGLLGLGWSIGGVSSITRIPKTIYHDGKMTAVEFDQASTVFALNGNRLLNVSSLEYGASNCEYRTEYETFDKVVSYEGGSKNQPKKFQVWAKNGLIYEYGFTDDSRIEAQGKEDVLLWYLNKVSDNYGNYVEYEYYENKISGESRIKKISYTGNSNTGLLPYNTVEFIYKTKPDISIEYVDGSKVTNSVVLEKIRVESESELVREYEFNYIKQGVNTALHEVVEYNRNNERFNSTIVDWGDYTIQQNVKNLSIGYLSPTNTKAYQFYDFSGDGKTDIFSQYNGNAYTINWQLNLKVPDEYPEYTETDRACTGRWYTDAWIDTFHYVQTVAFADLNGDKLNDIFTLDSLDIRRATNKHSIYIDINESSTNPNVFDTENPYTCDIDLGGNKYHHHLFGDFNGDGKEEIILILLKDGNTIYKFLEYENDELVISEDHNWEIQPADTLITKIKGKSLDYNGDGKTDVLFVKDKNLYVYSFNDNMDFVLEYSLSEAIPSGSELLFGDMNNDGKTDIINHHPSLGVRILMNTGSASIPQIKYFDLSSLSYPYHSSAEISCVTGDFDGNGYTDIAIIENLFIEYNNTVFYIYYNDGSNFTLESYDYPNEIDLHLNTPFVTDFYGTGVNQIVFLGYNSDCSRQYCSGDSKVFYFSQDRNHCFVSSINNGINSQSSFVYKSLTDSTVYEKYSDATGDLYDVISANYVVSSFSTPNGVGGNNTTNYYYRGNKAHKYLGNLGFMEFETSNSISGFKNVQKYSLDSDYYYKWLQKSEKYLISDNSILLRTVYENSKIEYGNNRILQYARTTTENDYVKDVEVITGIDIDNDGNLTSKSVNLGTQGSLNKSYSYITKGAWCPSKVSKETSSMVRTGEDPYIRETNYTYTDNGKVLTIATDGPKPVTTTFTYNSSYGNIIKESVSASDIETRFKEYEYDEKWRFQVKATNALGHSVSSIYDNATGNILSFTDVNGLVTTYNYDGFGRLSKVINPDGNESYQVIDWDDNSGINNALYYTENGTDGGNPEIEIFDVLGRPIRKVSVGFNGSDILSDIEYNSKGQKVKTTAPYFDGGTKDETEILYDELGREYKIKSPNKIVQLSYSGLTVSSKNLSVYPNKTTTVRKDVFGSIDRVTDALGNAVNYDYYSSGLLKQVSSPGSQVTSYEYDHYGNQTKKTEPNSGIYTWYYNALGELISENKNGSTMTFDYDITGRLTSFITPATNDLPEFTTTYGYDDEEKGIGRLAEISNTLGASQSFTYDSYGRITDIEESIEDKSFTESFTYDDYGRIISLQYPSDFTIDYKYNANNYLYQIIRSDVNEVIWEGQTVNARGQLEQFKLGNDLVTNNTYIREFLSTIKTGTVQDLKYIWDAATGNLKSRWDYRHDVNLWEKFSYDDLDRLTTEVLGMNSGFTGTISNSYADNGNIEKTTELGDFIYDASKPNALVSLKGSFIENQQINYNYFNQVTSLNHNGTEKQLTIDYGVDGKRRKMTLEAGRNLTRYYSHDNYEEDTQGSITTKRHYLSGSSGLFGIYEEKDSVGSMYYIHKDHLGSFDVITDESGTIVERNSFDPWGNRRDPDTWEVYDGPVETLFDRGYTGHEHLNEFELINMGGRMYDPRIHLFLSPDPVIADPANTQNYNVYSYCYNNPLKYTDPTGWYPQYENGEWRFYDSEGNSAPISEDQARAWAENSGADFNDLRRGIYDTDELNGFDKKASQALADQEAENQATWEMYEAIYNATNGGGGYTSVTNGGGWDLNGDGQLTLHEANNWYRNGNGQAITVDASLINITNVNPNELSSTKTTPINFQFRGPTNFGLTYGTLDLTLVGNNKVSITPNMYDFDIGAAQGHPWFGAGVRGFVRNLGTLGGNMVARSGTPFMVNFSGYANLNYSPPAELPGWQYSPAVP